MGGTDDSNFSPLTPVVQDKDPLPPSHPPKSGGPMDPERLSPGRDSGRLLRTNRGGEGVPPSPCPTVQASGCTRGGRHSTPGTRTRFKFLVCTLPDPNPVSGPFLRPKGSTEAHRPGVLYRLTPSSPTHPPDPCPPPLRMGAGPEPSKLSVYTTQRIPCPLFPEGIVATDHSLPLPSTLRLF